MTLATNINRIVSHKQKFAFGAQLLIPIVATFILPIFGRSIFWVNDDVGHLLWQSGGFSGSPEYQNPVLGLPFSFLVSVLYRSRSGIPWYPLLVLVVPLVASNLLVRHIQKRCTAWQSMLVVVVVSSALFLLGAQINYTYASFVACGALAALFGMKSREDDLTQRSYLVPAFVCVFSLSLRSNWALFGFGIPQPFLFSAVVALVFFIPRLGQQPRRFLIRFTTVVASIYLLAGLPQFVVMRLDEKWADFINFYSARGALNGVTKVDDYLLATSAQTVLRQTGMDSADVFQLGSWSLFDARDVTTENLLALRQAADNSIQVEQDATGKFVALFADGLAWLFTSEIAVLVGILLVGVVLTKKLASGARWVVHRALPAYLVAVGLVVFATIGVRSPNYVMFGTYAVLAVIGATALPAESHTTTSPKAPKAAVLVGFAAFLGFLLWGTVALEQTAGVADARVRAEAAREVLTSSQESSMPIVHDVMLVGIAYQVTPFDSSIPGHYFLTKNFSGGSNVRSPQHVRRWNAITQSNETAASLFNESFYTRVLLPENFASVFRSLLVTRGECFTNKKSDLAGYVQLESRECTKLVSLEPGYRDQPDLWWSTEYGFLFQAEVDLTDGIQLQLYSPFGEFAQPHLAEVTITTPDGENRLVRRVVVEPFVGSRFEVPTIFAAEFISIRSLDPCVVPFELDPLRFPDSRKLCIGLGGIALNGKLVSLNSTLP